MLIEIHDDAERILSLLTPYARMDCAAPVFADIASARRMLAKNPFTTPELAERMADRLLARYRCEIRALYGPGGSPVRPSDSAWLRLAQLIPTLVRVAVARLCLAGELTLTRGQIAQGDGLLLQSLSGAVARAQRERPLRRAAR